MKGKSSSSLELVKLCCRALDEKKAGDLRVLDVSEQSSITDYLVIATGTSEPHLRALRIELEKAIDASHTRIVGMETAQESGWLVVDAFDVMVHLFPAGCSHALRPGESLGRRHRSVGAEAARRAEKESEVRHERQNQEGGPEASRDQTQGGGTREKICQIPQSVTLYGGY
ncbi:MAG: ribosome silencing factor [Opitutus sp.]|nr:ribosome silencing factor [Opitutus sp.]